MEIAFYAQLIIPVVCGILAYILFRKVKNKEDTQKSDFRKWFSTIKFWWCTKRRKKIYEYLREEKFDKLKAIENVKSEEELKKIINEENISDSSLFYGNDQKGNSLFLKLNSKGNEKELLLFLNLSDGRTYELPDHPSTISFNSTKQSWSIGGLKISVCEPLTRWRITFNGLLRNGIRKNTIDDIGKIEHVRFNFIFIANSVPLSKSDFWSKDLKKKYRNSMENNGFDQWGSFIGQLVFEDSSTKEIFLRGLRQREWDSKIILKFDRIISFFGSINGLTFYLNIGKLKDCSEIVKFGHFKMIDGTIHAVDLINLNTEAFTNPEERNPEILQFKARDKLYEFSTTLQKDSKRLLHHGHVCDENYLTYEIQLKQNKDEGSALVLIWYSPNSNSSKKTTSEFSSSLQPNSMTKNFVVSFRDEICQNEELVGGKGNSLALLTSIETNDFSIPQGFCVTAPALQHQIDSCENLSQAIDDIERININRQSGNLKKYCEKVVFLLQNTTIVEPVREAILKALIDLEDREKLNKKQEYLIRYAVRSSAVGEDSEETSAAGQNSTFLGIKDPENILKYVAHCWASLYTYQSVEYRRRLGLSIKASMGVCIQIMVDAEIAGVMFTRHPTTGDPRNIVITSNYGLGESVVSAMVEPDTVILERDWNDLLTIESIEIGKKSQKITMTENSGTVRKELTEEEIRKNSLSNQVALKLAKVGLLLDNLFQNPRDVEWAIVGDKIFLLQSRPITSLDNWTDFELTHELDSAVPIANDILTFANVGEVFPGVTSPLTISTFIVFLNGVINHHFKKPSIVPYCEYNMHVSSMRITINYFNTMLAYVEEEVNTSVKIIDVAVCGHVIATTEVHKQAKERNGTMNFVDSLLLKLDMASEIWNVEAKSKEMVKVFENMRLEASQINTIQDLYRAIDNSLVDLEVVGDCHSATSRVSVFYEVLLMSILTENSSDLTVDHYSDIAVLLGSCSDVVSAQVPIALRRISKLIRDSGKWEEFSEIDFEIVTDWLKENCSEAANLLEKFLNDYGHRSIKEMDLITETWIMKPEKLFSAIQAMVKCPTDTTENVDLSPEETVVRLKTPKKNLTKWILRKVVPFSRKAVTRREMTKSVLTHMLHKFRLCYRKLAKLLAIENRLPDESLIFFLTHYEIGLLVEKPDLTLVRKAFRRQRLYSKLEKDQFPELNIGVPEPLQFLNEKLIHQSLVKITGSSVYNGTIYARACVITNLSQAGEIQSGDILITHSTDIGWSPYFPLLGGVVTELGGLISHGAVVAREYGLPCIVGAEGATRIFKTGQMVLLNANVGSVETLNENV